MNISCADLKMAPFFSALILGFVRNVSPHAAFSMVSHLSCLYLYFNMFISVVNSGKRYLDICKKKANNHTRQKHTDCPL